MLTGLHHRRTNTRTDALAATRTPTDLLLRQAPLPIGLQGQTHNLSNSRTRTRTWNHRFNRPERRQLRHARSYSPTNRPTEPHRVDLNHRPSALQADAATRLSYNGSNKIVTVAISRGGQNRTVDTCSQNTGYPISLHLVDFRTFPPKTNRPQGVCLGPIARSG